MQWMRRLLPMLHCYDLQFNTRTDGERTFCSNLKDCVHTVLEKQKQGYEISAGDWEQIKNYVKELVQPQTSFFCAVRFNGM